MARRSLTGARVLLTGASSGIGLALARRLAAQGASLLVTARRQDRLAQLTAELSAAHGTTRSSMHYVAGDITDPRLRRALWKKVRQEFGGLDILVNNAGVGAVGPFAEADEPRLRRIMEVNFFAPAELTRLLLPTLAESPSGLIVNVGSVLGHCAVPKKSEYCASKFALHGWSDALDCELRQAGIRVLLVSPSTTQSEFFDRLLEKKGNVASHPHALSADAVAKRIVRAMQRNRRQLWISASTRALIWLDRLTPRLLSAVLARFG